MMQVSFECATSPPAALAGFAYVGTLSADTGSAPFIMNDDGELERPKNYRSWVYVGTPLTPNYLNVGAAPFPEFHSVYIDPIYT